MKTIFNILISALLLLIAFPTDTHAQASQSPYNVSNPYYTWPFPIGGYSDSTAVKYFNSRVDTVPNTWYPTLRTFLRVGGYSLSSFTVEVSDTARLMITVKARTRPRATGTVAGAWTTILSDSLANYGASSSSGAIQEYSIRDTDSDLLDAVDTEIMIIISHSADRNDTQRTADRRIRFNYK